MSERVVINENVYWFKDGKKHREDGPAVESFNGTKYWYNNGKLHREDGPAIEYYDGTVQYWVNNTPLSDIEVFVKFGIINS